ncbi:MULTISPECIES: hypothetical protein [unclassified Brevundimonas]|uniref:hypothetical protein n=1 Tax=unclassified Brevundimonas TaxID=2622653 RepID=UPI0025BE1A3C|nr:MULTISPECIES: hypothetical protein [unclassified Brevundimonas]
MRSSLNVLLVLAAMATPVVAVGQTDVGANHHGGLHWSVAAPQGAAWSLSCGFSPVTLDMGQYDRKHWANRLTLRGRGPQRGRLPGDNGSCTLTKTGGQGPVGIALVKNGSATAAGTNLSAAPAQINVF